MIKIPVLDHGWVKLRNMAGPTRRVHQNYDANDVDPANVARKSFDQMDSGRDVEEDIRLANYLMRNWHTTPFEHVVIWIEMKLPIFVARQLIRHRTASVDEVSGRYVQLPSEWYVPALDDVVFQTKDKKQGGRLIDTDEPEERQKAENFRMMLNLNCEDSYANYLKAIEDGIAMEQARLLLHLNHYTQWIWKQDLHNMMHLLALRDHSHAQKEAQKYAIAIDTSIRTYLPESMNLYDKYRRFE